MWAACNTPCCLSSFIICFRTRILFLVSKMCTICWIIMYRYSFLWCIHVRLIFVIQIYVPQVKVSFWLIFSRKKKCTHQATWYEKPKVLEKNHNKLQLLDFLNDKYFVIFRCLYVLFLFVRLSIMCCGCEFLFLQILCYFWHKKHKNHPFQLCLRFYPFVNHYEIVKLTQMYFERIFSWEFEGKIPLRWVRCFLLYYH